MKLARIVDGVIAEFISIPEGTPQTITVEGEDGDLVTRPTTMADCFHPDFLAALVSVPNAAQLGWIDQDGTFVAPPPPVVVQKRQFSFLEFMDLFTDEEQLALAGAAMTDAATKLWYDRSVGAQFISLDDPRLADGLQALVEADLISTERRDRVLHGLPPAA